MMKFRSFLRSHILPAISFTTFSVLVNYQASCFDICLFPNGKGFPIPFLSDYYATQIYLGIFVKVFALPIFIFDAFFWLIFWVFLKVVYKFAKKLQVSKN